MTTGASTLNKATPKPTALMKGKLILVLGECINMAIGSLPLVFNSISPAILPLQTPQMSAQSIWSLDLPSAMIQPKKMGSGKMDFIWNNVFQVSVNSPFSDQSFIRNAATLTYTFPLDKNWNRVVLNGNFGAIDVDNIQDIAPNFRFYSGGIGNLLGYPYLSQGPKVNGNVTGGKYLATGLVGIEQRIVGNFSTLLYYNLGNATNDLDFHDVEILKASGDWS